jgi:hypothetical protein
MWTCARTAIRGPFGSARSSNSCIGVQLTDSAYVAVSMRIMTRMGRDALDVLVIAGLSCRACTLSVCRFRMAFGMFRGRHRSVNDSRQSSESNLPAWSAS